MEINVLDDKKTVEIWLTNAEKNDPELRAGLKDIFAEWKKKKYTVAVYESGEKDLYQCTRDLLIYNKKRLAALEVKKAKEDKPPIGSSPSITAQRPIRSG